MTSKQLLAVPEAAVYLGITKQAVYQLTKQGIGTRVGNMWVFTRTELDTWRAQAQPKAGRAARSTPRDTAVARPGAGGTVQAVAVSSRRPKEKLPTTVSIDDGLHWAADATTTLCGKRWSPAQMVRPSTNVCPRCRAEASKRGL